MVDATHTVGRRSWVERANGHPDFPIQNLPFGLFSPPGGTPRGGVAIGDAIFDLKAAEAACGDVLNPLLALGTPPRQALRTRLGDLLDADGTERSRLQELRGRLLHAAADCRLHLPARIGDYTDFFAGIHHATNTGRQLRPDSPLLPNYKHLPVGYHGRASSIVASGERVHRPSGQRKPASATAPGFGPSRALDFELELGVWIGPGNDLGAPIPIEQAADRIGGFCLLNDWSARDIQAFEYQPLGPFLGKSFATSISSWIVTPEALAPFRIPQAARPDGEPRPLDYLLDEHDQNTGALDIELEVFIVTEGMRAQNRPPHRLSASNARHLYWTVAQMVAHHASGGCNLRPGDLFGTGTISAPGDAGFGSLLELTQGGRTPVTLAFGETRRFLEDGDEVILRAHGRREGFATIGFGECRGTIIA